MGEVAGYKVAECLPKTLLRMLDTLCEHDVKTWNIYPDQFGISVRIRFDIGEGNGSGAGSSLVYMQGSTGQARQQPTTYTRKTPSQQRRDSERKILKAKKRKVEENSETENERNNEMEDQSTNQCDTPMEISCEPPVEDTLVLSPLPPMKLEFLQNELKCKTESGNVMILEEDSIEDTDMKLVNEIDPLKCPNCYKSIMKWDHVCDDDSQSDDTINGDTKNDSKIVSNEASDERDAKMVKTIESILRKMWNLPDPP